MNARIDVAAGGSSEEIMKKLVLAMIAFAALTACGAAPEPRAHNRAEALKKIREAEQTAIRAFGKRNAGESASMYAPDATLMLTNMRAVQGADIRPVLSEMMADPNFSMTFNTAKVEAPESGEFGYTRGTYIMTTTDPKSKKPFTGVGQVFNGVCKAG